MITVETFDGLNPKSKQIPYTPQSEDFRFCYKGKILAGVHLTEIQKAILSELAQGSAYMKVWLPVQAFALAMRLEVPLSDVLFAAQGLQDAGLVKGYILRSDSQEYILPTELGARALWMAWMDEHIIPEKE